MKKVIDLTEKKFGKLTVVRQEYIKNRHLYWFCKCDCGNECVVKGDKIKSGHTKSCGCLKKEKLIERNTRHRDTSTRLYAIWAGIISRCHNPNRQKAKRDYQDRGIIVCKEWHDFQCFKKWSLANGYEESLTIDRIDNNRNYEPSNCRWATAKVQGNNKRNNRNITYKGETHTIAQWSEIIGIKYGTLYHRLLKFGWPLETALTTLPYKRMVV